MHTYWYVCMFPYCKCVSVCGIFTRETESKEFKGLLWKWEALICVSFLKGRVWWLPPQLANVRSCQPCVFFALEENLVSIMSLLSSWFKEKAKESDLEGYARVTGNSHCIHSFLIPASICRVLVFKCPLLRETPFVHLHLLTLPSIFFFVACVNIWPKHIEST